LIDSYLSAHSTAIDELRRRAPDLNRDVSGEVDALRQVIEAIRVSTHSLVNGNAVEFSVQTRLFSATAAFVCAFDHLLDGLGADAADSDVSVLLERYAETVDRYNGWQAAASQWVQYRADTPLSERDYRRWHQDPAECELDSCQCETVLGFSGPPPVSVECGPEDPECE